MRRASYSHMTNKEFFLATIENEAPIFIRVLNALPEEKAEFRPHEKARPAENIAMQLATQPLLIANILNLGDVNLAEEKMEMDEGMDITVSEAEKNFAELMESVDEMSEEEWENGKASVVFPNGRWETGKRDMAWGLLFDMIHHRGQLSTYIRAMDEKVPSIYGGSADESAPV